MQHKHIFTVFKLCILYRNQTAHTHKNCVEKWPYTYTHTHTYIYKDAQHTHTHTDRQIDTHFKVHVMTVVIS